MLIFCKYSYFIYKCGNFSGIMYSQKTFIDFLTINIFKRFFLKTNLKTRREMMEVKEIIKKVEKYKETDSAKFEKIMTFLEGALFVTENGERYEKQKNIK